MRLNHECAVVSSDLTVAAAHLAAGASRRDWLFTIATDTAKVGEFFQRVPLFSSCQTSRARSPPRSVCPTLQACSCASSLLPVREINLNSRQFRVNKKQPFNGRSTISLMGCCANYGWERN
eukprot:2946326-Amphidinium_carterae.3